MRSFAVLSALVALAAAAPRPQEIAEVENIIAPTTYSDVLTATSVIHTIDLSSAVSAVAQSVSTAPVSAATSAAPTSGESKRDQVLDKVIEARVVTVSSTQTAVVTSTSSSLPACTPLPTTPNVYKLDLSTPAAFQGDPKIANLSSSVPTPSGYNLTFSGLNFSTEHYGYQGYTFINTYDPSLCAAQCNTQAGCLGFNLYIEYDPIVDPAPNCPAPNATANIKCRFWAGPVFADTATQPGQWREDFWVAIAGSNGYTSTRYEVVPGYSAPTYFGMATINAPNDCNGVDTYMGHQLFTTNAFDASLCTTLCDSTSAYNIRNTKVGAPRLCRFAVTYVLYIDGAAQGQYCAMYTEAWNSTYATNVGSNVNGHQYTLDYSFGYANATDPGTPICPADVAYLKANAEPFCSSYLGTHSTTVKGTTTLGTSTKIVTKVSTVSSTVVSTKVVTKQFTTTVSLSSSVTITAVPKMKRTGGSVVPTPTSIVSWLPARLSAGCSLVATAPVITSTSYTTKPAPTTTTTLSTLTTKFKTSTTSTTTSVAIKTVTKSK